MRGRSRAGNDLEINLDLDMLIVTQTFGSYQVIQLAPPHHPWSDSF